VYKLLFVAICTVQFLFAQDIKFSEKRYIYAIDNEFSKNGKLFIDEKKVVLQYMQSEKKVIYTKDIIQVIDGDTVQNFTHEENVQYDLFFQLVLAIYNNELQKLQENFQVKRADEEIILFPKEQIASIIKKISFKKVGQRLKYLTIYFQNQDRITIEQTN
jgi:hypothetical protein